jgi:phage terminase Nu1 subunit (DNA packaging protein)
MPEPLSLDLRERIVAAYERGDLTRDQVAELFQALVDAGRRVSERRVTGAPAVIAAELAVALAGVPVSPEQRRRWHALLSAEAPIRTSAAPR